MTCCSPEQTELLPIHKLILEGAESCGYDALEAGALVDRALLSLL